MRGQPSSLSLHRPPLSTSHGETDVLRPQRFSEGDRGRFASRPRSRPGSLAGRPGERPAPPQRRLQAWRKARQPVRQQARAQDQAPASRDSGTRAPRALTARSRTGRREGKSPRRGPSVPTESRLPAPASWASAAGGSRAQMPGPPSCGPARSAPADGAERAWKRRKACSCLLPSLRECLLGATRA